MSVIDGVLALAIGAAYTGLGVITFDELRRHWRDRGLSRFGVGFFVMAMTCGPHHLIHGVHVLFEGERIQPTVTASLALGLLPGLTFVGLRIETILGGRGDRLVRGGPGAMGVVAVVIAFAAGIISAAIAAKAIAAGGVPWQGLPGLVLVVAYTIVGWYLARAQVQRGLRSREHSLSGLSLSAIFPTCALMHLALSLGRPDVHIFMIDLVGVPAALFFLWVVNRLHHEALADWNRSPLVGGARATRRASPWLPEVAAESAGR